MSTDIARLDGSSLAIPAGATEAFERLGAWVTAASQAHQLVAPLVGTHFIPDAYRPKVDPRATDEVKEEARQLAIANATAAVLQGITLGLDPMTALQQIYIVKGRPGLYARIKVALLQARGHEVWTEELSDTQAVVAGRRKGSQHIERITVTMEQARKAGWTTNEAYAKTPQDMLYARAAGRVCDRIGAAELMGIASVEEIPDTVTVTAEFGQPDQPGTGRVTAAEILAATPPTEPPPQPAEPDPPAQPAEPQPEPEPSRMSEAQKRRLFSMLKSRGYQDKDAALALIAIVIGREITSRNELTAQETDKVIAKLEQMAVLNGEPS
jgi:hypothetical protein